MVKIMARQARIQMRQQPNAVSPLTKVAFMLGLLAVGVMGYLYLMHKDIPEDAAWVKYCLYMLAFGAIGLVGLKVLNKQPIIPREFTPLGGDTAIKAALILGASMLTQLVSQGVLSFATSEQVTYYVFAAVCEELFYRVLILSMAIKLADVSAGKSANHQWAIKGGAIVVQAAMFASLHENYYNNIPMLVSVFIGGIVLGLFFVIWQDATANILAHFMLNVIAVQNVVWLIPVMILGVLYAAYVSIRGAIQRK